MPEDRGLVPELTVEENILVPVWVSSSLKKAKSGFDFVYGVLPELAQMRCASDGRCCCPAASRSWWHWHGRWPWARGCCCWTSRSKGWRRHLSSRLADVIGGLRGGRMAVLIAQSDLNHSRRLVDAEFVIERGANQTPAVV